MQCIKTGFNRSRRCIAVLHIAVLQCDAARHYQTISMCKPTCLPHCSEGHIRFICTDMHAVLRTVRIGINHIQTVHMNYQVKAADRPQRGCRLQNIQHIQASMMHIAVSLSRSVDKLNFAHRQVSDIYMHKTHAY